MTSEEGAGSDRDDVADYIRDLAMQLAIMARAAGLRLTAATLEDAAATAEREAASNGHDWLG